VQGIKLSRVMGSGQENIKKLHNLPFLLRKKPMKYTIPIGIGKK
jgi:hypothetical protein